MEVLAFMRGTCLGSSWLVTCVTANNGFPLNSVSARPLDRPKKVRDVRIVLPDMGSPAAMAEAEAIGKGRPL